MGVGLFLWNSGTDWWLCKINVFFSENKNCYFLSSRRVGDQSASKSVLNWITPLNATDTVSPSAKFWTKKGVSVNHSNLGGFSFSFYHASRKPAPVSRTCILFSHFNIIYENTALLIQEKVKRKFCIPEISKNKEGEGICGVFAWACGRRKNKKLQDGLWIENWGLSKSHSNKNIFFV